MVTCSILFSGSGSGQTLSCRPVLGWAGTSFYVLSCQDSSVFHWREASKQQRLALVRPSHVHVALMEEAPSLVHHKILPLREASC